MLTPLLGDIDTFEPSEEMVSEHMAEVFSLGRDYIVKTFNLDVDEEGFFNPVRFNSMGVWGDFQVRLKELGDDRFEVQGWVLHNGSEGTPVFWSVVVKYKLEDPEAWRYRRLDREYPNDPDFLGWKFGVYSSSPYNAEYSREYEYSLISR